MRKTASGIAVLSLAVATLCAWSPEVAEAYDPTEIVVFDASGAVPEVRTETLNNPDAAAERIDVLTAESGVTASVTTEYHLTGGGSGEISQWSHQSMDTAGAWAQGVDGTGVMVAVIDSGIAESSPDLAGKVIKRADFAGVRGSKEHGTKVAGVIAATAGNGVGVAGVAPGVSIIDARACSDATCQSDAVMNAIIWSVAQGADILNLSLGGGWDPGVAAAVSWAVAQGAVVVAAAGNSGCNAIVYSYTGEAGGNGNCLKNKPNTIWPARLPHVIAVGAIEESGNKASYSSFGPQTDIGAPTEIVSVGPWQYDSFNGTSAAAPQVSAVAALALQANPQLTPTQVQAVIQAGSSTYASQLTHQTWDSCGPYNTTTGVWDDCVGLSSTAVSQRWLGGGGRVNAAEAVRLAKTAQFDVPVTLENGSLVFNATWSASRAGATLRVDSKTLGVLQPGVTYPLDGYEPGVQYAVSIVKDSYVGLSLVTGTANSLAAPVVTSAKYTSGGLSISTTGIPGYASNAAVVLNLYNQSGVLQDGCDSWDGGKTALCRVHQVSSQSGSYHIRYLDPEGVMSQPSVSFYFTGTSNLTLSTPEIVSLGNTGSVASLVFKRVSGAHSYVSFAGTSWFRVGDDGSILGTLNSAPIPGLNCSAGPVNMVCNHATTDGEMHRVTVVADADGLISNGYNSPRSSIVRHITETLPVAESADIKFEAVVQSSGWPVRHDVKISWGREQGSNVLGSYEIYTAAGEVRSGSAVNGRWNATVRVPDWATAGSDRDSIPVTVVGYFARGGYTTYGAGVTVNVYIPPTLPSMPVECVKTQDGVGCSRNSPERMEIRYIAGGSVVKTAEVSSFYFTVEEGYSLEMRRRPSASGFLRSEWFSVPIETLQEETPNTTTPDTQPPVTQPPVVQPPVTQPPVTQPPVTQPPVTQPPVTQPPAGVGSETTIPPYQPEQPRTVLTASSPISVAAVFADSGLAFQQGGKMYVTVNRASSRVCRISGGNVRFKDDGECKLDVKIKVKNRTVASTVQSYQSVEDPLNPVSMNVERNGSVLTLGVGGSISYRQLAEHLEMTYPRSAKVTVVVPSKDRRVCKTSGGAVRVLRAGTCSVSVKVTIRGRTRMTGTVSISGV